MSTRIAAASGKYVSQVRDRLSDIGSTTRRAAPIISAIKTRMKKTDAPFTQVGSQKSYTPQESSPAPQSEGLGDIAGAAQDAVQGGLERIKEARKKRKDKRINKIEKKPATPVKKVSVVSEKKETPKPKPEKEKTDATTKRQKPKNDKQKHKQAKKRGPKPKASGSNRSK